MECVYRKITKQGTICGLAKLILKSQHDELYVINETTCENCFATNEIPNTKKVNKVIVELLSRAAEEVIISNGVDDCSPERAQKLLDHINNPEKTVKVLSTPKKGCGCKKP